jgi:hypothetical protein
MVSQLVLDKSSAVGLPGVGLQAVLIKSKVLQAIKHAVFIIFMLVIFT